MTQFAPGTLLGPYKIEAPLGAGGMGEVFRGVDTRLGRPVAIKTCRRRFSERFGREARAISSLNHPHICTLYDVGPDYLVMELLEGETLSSRLSRGKFSMQQTIEYGSEIADALAAAHAKGIIHRDLKPQNIMLTKTGVKVLDFGLAKSSEDETLTITDAVLGTPAYMAPEQREGKPCSPESDIYSLGLVLYEMATGKRPSGNDPTASTHLPEKLVHIIDRCLAADPNDRWESARDIKSELEWFATRPAARSVDATEPTRWRWPALSGLCLVILAAVLYGFFHYRQPRAGEMVSLRLSVSAPQGTEIREGSVVSPDGRMVVLAVHGSGPDKLWIRSLDSLAMRELPGTEDAIYPFWSPDSRFVAFFGGGKLKRIDVGSGVATVICDVGVGRGGTWNKQGTILFNSVNDGPLLKVFAAGGMPTPLTTVDASRGENSHRFPYFLPDSRHFLYYIRSSNVDTQGVYLGSLDDPNQKVRLLNSPTSTAAVFAPAVDGGLGHLAWVNNGNLMVQPFDPNRAQLSGEAIALAENVHYNPAGRYADISVSRNGILAYGNEAVGAWRLTWFDRGGKPFNSIGERDSYRGVRISPDGTRVAVFRDRTSAHSGGIAIVEIARGIATPVTKGFWGSWSPDGKRIVYGWSLSGPPNLYEASASGQGDPERLTNSQNSETVLDWSADGRFILYAENPNDVAAATKAGLWVLPLADLKPFLFVQTREPHAQFSPDGQWITYSSTESGRTEIYVESFPTGRAKWQISSNGGNYPRWRKDGRELFYVGPDQTLMSVTLQPSSDLAKFSRPIPMFKVPMPSPVGSDYPYDVSSDGRRVLALSAAEDAQEQTLVVMSNWQAEYKTTNPH